MASRFRKEGSCPKCRTWQNFKLVAWQERAVDAAKEAVTKPWNLVFRSIKGVTQSMSGNDDTPSLQCVNCKAIFFECPHCHDTTIITERRTWDNVHCQNCHKRLVLVENYGFE
jgi:hypothetical protein